jgi:hypothetical protein
MSFVFRFNIACRVLPVTAMMLALCSCNLDKLANQMEARESHFPSGHHEARGGVSYTSSVSGPDWSRTVFTCRSSGVVSGLATIHFGAGSGDLPLTVTQDVTGPSSVQLVTPNGSLTFDRPRCSTLMSAPIPNAGANPVLGSTGVIVFDCSKDGKSIRGRVSFNQCGG